MSCENIVAVVGNEILFNQDLIKPNGFVIKLPVSHYYSKWGFLVPTAINAFNVIEYLNGARDIEVSAGGVILCYFITHDGVMEEWVVTGPGSACPILRRILPWGPEVVHCRSNSGPVEEAWTAALDATDDDLDRALALVQQTHRVTSARVVKLQIPEIIEELNRRFPLPDGERPLRGTLRPS